MSTAPAPTTSDRASAASADRRTTLVGALVVLSVSTGILDAVSYLALDRVFTGNMTGNVLFIGFALGGLAELPVLNLVLALACFVVGAALAALVLRGAASDGIPRRSLWILCAGAVLTTLTGVAWAIAGTPSGAMPAVATGVLALVLGAQAAALKPAGVRDISTVVVTMTIVNLASDGWLAGRRDPHWLRKVLGILAMGVGAFAGAALVLHVGGAAAVFAAAAVMAAGILVLALSRRRA